MTIAPTVLAARETAEVLFPREMVLQAIDRLSVRLSVALAEANPLLICVLHGGLPFTAAVMQRLQFPLELTYLHVGRYGETTRGGALTWHARPRLSLAGRHVVLLDDIVDEGVTLGALRAFCLGEGAQAVTTAVLLDKAAVRERAGAPPPDHAALTCPDRYVFGWGMDFEGYWRNLPDVYALPPHLESSQEAG
ncbi:MAG: hypoxanthine-guanine phosphoribosyltransferase [Pseudomonadales bacterium]